MAQIKNLVNELFVNANRPEQGDNRSYYVKSLNKILNDGIITIAIKERGMHWTNSSFVDSNGKLKPFDVKISGYGMIRRCFLREFNAEDLLKQVAKFVHDPRISEKHTTSLKVSGLDVVECYRCNGRGFIPGFSHVCQGICFECYGSKYVQKKYTLSV
jgi:hypothetical protein